MPPAYTTWGLTMEEVQRRPMTPREERYYADGLAAKERRTWRKTAVQDRLKAKLAAKEAKPKK